MTTAIILTDSTYADHKARPINMTIFDKGVIIVDLYCKDMADVVRNDPFGGTVAYNDRRVYDLH
jgi:hypothetical protein